MSRWATIPISEPQFTYCRKKFWEEYFVNKPSAGRLGPKAARTKANILATATRLVAVSGFAGATARNVAEAAGIATGTIYRFYGSLEELHSEVFRKVATVEFLAVEEALRGEQSVRNQILSLVDVFSSRALRSRNLAEALLFEPVNPFVEQERLVYRSKYHELLADVIRNGVEGGEIPLQDSDLSARALVGAIAESLMGRLAPPQAEPKNDTQMTKMITHIGHFCLRAIGAEMENHT